MARGRQPDLLDWQPPEPVVRFADPAVRSATVNGRIAKAIAATLAGLDRTEVARAMSEYLGKPVTKHMVDAYASVARDDHVISTARLAALLHATGDRRLLELLAEPMGWAVIERRYLPLIDLAVLQDKQDELRRRGDALKRQARQQGVL